jgi:hypothetical protein
MRARISSGIERASGVPMSPGSTALQVTPAAA